MLSKILERQGVKPILWEDFAKPSGLSIQDFYLHYLETCQLYLGIFGEQDSPATENEYREAVVMGLQRWIFVKDEARRGQQMSRLVELAENEVRDVREKFASDSDLLGKVQKKLQEYLSETTREYLELRKRRTQDFLADYRKNFLEPLLTELQLILIQLENKQPLEYSYNWNPNNFRIHPHYRLDEELKENLDSFFAAFEKCREDSVLANKVSLEICDRVANSFVGTLKDGLTEDQQKDIRERIKQVLYQSPLMYVGDIRKLSDQEIAKMKERVWLTMSHLPNEVWYILGTAMTQQKIDGHIHSLAELIEKNSDVAAYIAARSNVEKAANKTYQMIWKRYVDATGYQPLP
jgi:predicted house-cleaning noncanonical NTP pyrophosphatase (MazG superfamily)